MKLSRFSASSRAAIVLSFAFSKRSSLLVFWFSMLLISASGESLGIMARRAWAARGVIDVGMVVDDHRSFRNSAPRTRVGLRIIPPDPAIGSECRFCIATGLSLLLPGGLLGN